MVAEAFDLTDKVAIIAGEGRRWSGPLALALAEAGADVVVAARDGEESKATAAQVQRLGRRGVAIPTDTTQGDQVRALRDKTLAEFGKVDILVNVGDLEFAKPLLEVTQEEWRRVIDTNLTATFLCCQALGKPMLAQQKGRIINIASCRGARGISNGAAYCASKGGVIQLTRALALEWAREGVRVNALCPGWFATTEAEAQAQAGERWVRYIPLRRLGLPTDIAALVIYLASDAADFVTGQAWFVEGGVMAR